MMILTKIPTRVTWSSRQLNFCMGWFMHDTLWLTVVLHRW